MTCWYVIVKTGGLKPANSNWLSLQYVFRVISTRLNEEWGPALSSMNSASCIEP